jgi:hypothetical protein
VQLVPTTIRWGSGTAAGRRGASLGPEDRAHDFAENTHRWFPMNVNVRIERTFWLRAAANYIAKAK